MAFLKEFAPVERAKPKLHDKTRCEYAIYDVDSKRLLQLDTVGSDRRKMKGKISQSVQVDEAAARELLRILKLAFPALT